MYVLHAVKREPKGFEDVHENISANVSFDEQLFILFFYSIYEIIVLSQFPTND
jgi:hypothetical protein